jgi:Tfp pilus assembly protein PilO
MNQRISVIAGTVVVFMLLGWYVAFWRPATSHLSKAHATESAAQARQAVLDSQLARLVALERALPTSERELRASEPALPVSISVDTAIDQVNAIAVRDHISWTNEGQSVAGASSSTAGGSSSAGASASPSTTGSGNSTLDLTMDVSGTYAHMSTFITDLEHRPRLVVIDSLSYAPAQRLVAVTIAARAFFDSSPLPVIPKGFGGA